MNRIYCNTYSTGQKGFVAEKLDGSNLAVTSYGVIASRRNVLLFKPTDKELDKCKFSGVKLHKAAAMVPKLGKLVQTFSAHCKASNLEVILYGELVQKGTATSTEDKYGYRSRGYEEGGYYIFGLGLSGLKLDEANEIENALKNLKEKGFSCVVKVSDNTCDMVLLMNKELQNVLLEHNINNTIDHYQITLSEALSRYEKSLITGSLEGIVINFGNEIFKWKGLDESYPDLFMNEIEETLSEHDLKNSCGSIIRVATESRKHWRRLKQEKATLFLLEKAYKSALTKMKNLEDRKNERNLGIKELNSFQEALEMEMSRDSHCDTNFQEMLPAFVQQKLKCI